MKKFIVSATFLGLFVLYTIYTKVQKDTPVTAVISSPVSSSKPTGKTPAPTGVNLNTPKVSPTSTTVATAGIYKDGQYTGSVADAHYGLLQVKAIIKGGKLTGVDILQFPDDRERSLEINGFALPRLESEAIKIQSAKVNIVSGATDSSIAFGESLAFALSQAKL